MQTIVWKTYRSALKVAHEKGARSIGTCLISAGKSKGTRGIKEIVQVTVDTIVAEARPGTEITLVAHTNAEIEALTTACKSIQEHIITHIMDYSTKLEEQRKISEAKAGARKAYAEVKEEKEAPEEYDWDQCGPGFINRHYYHLWYKSDVPEYVMKLIMNLDRAAAVGRLIIKALRRADFNVSGQSSDAEAFRCQCQGDL